jgi:hypothetical protein
MRKSYFLSNYPYVEDRQPTYSILLWRVRVTIVVTRTKDTFLFIVVGLDVSFNNTKDSALS